MDWSQHRPRRVGAVLTFALERQAEGINLDTVGVILMLVGGVGVIVSMLFWSSWGPYSRDGGHYCERVRPRHSHHRAKKVVKQYQDLVLANDAFDRFFAALDKPAESVPELVELFRRNPRLPER